MRKRYNLVFILLLGLVMLFSLVACNQSLTKPNPDIGGNGSAAGSLPANASAGLKFTFPVEMSSIFNSIYVDEFKLDKYVEYSVVYYNAEGAALKEVPYGGVSEDMIAEEDKQYLSVAGHHKIHVTAELNDNTTASGAFDLHLKNRGALSLAKYTFKLQDKNGGGLAYPYFGTLNKAQDEVVVNVEKGVTFDSWEEFTRAFQMRVDKKAIEYINDDTAQKKYNANSSGFPFTVDGDKTFSVGFTDDVITVTYDIKLPQEDLKLRDDVDPEDDPEKVFAIGGTGKYSNVAVQRSVGFIPQPSNEQIDLYHGYTFAGWYNKANGMLWRFSSTVGTEDINLEAHWLLKEYSLTVYTMGGEFREGIEDYVLKVNNNVVNVDNVSAEGINMHLVESTSRFSQSDHKLNRITFTGFKYDMDYNDCVALVTVNSNGKQVMMKVSDLYNPTAETAEKLLVKGDYFKIDGDDDELYSFKIDELYSDFQCTQKVDRKDGKVNDDQPVTYIKWLFDAPANGITGYDDIYLDKISDYIDVVFKDGYTRVAGGIRLDQISDWTVNDLVIPKEIKVYNKSGDSYEVLPIIEIGERALSNARGLTKLDLSAAKYLTTIGVEAFARDAYLTEIVMPPLRDNAIKNIGDRAFYGTAYEDKYSDNHDGAEFIVIGRMIYKYVGDAEKTEIDLSDLAHYYKGEGMDDYNDALAAVTSIESGAFERCTALTTLKLPSTITTIRNNALSGLEHFKTLVISGSADSAQKQSNLLNIGESAFDDTPFLSESGSLYNTTAKAVVIGNVYYRFIDKTATTADIPADNGGYAITHIAPQAFKGCTLLEKVTFGNEENIKSIGKNAFTETAILRKNKENPENPTLYTVFNHILTDYYGNLQDANAVNLIVPDNVKTIASGAFGQYGRYFETVQIGASVKRVEDYAFSGANMLSKVILTGVTTDGNTQRPQLRNAPSIGEYAFADANGTLRSGMKIYFNENVMSALRFYKSNANLTPSDSVTAEWVNLFTLHEEVFEEEGIESVVIDTNKISKVLMQTTEETDVSEGAFTLPFTDAYGNVDNSNKDKPKPVGCVNDALVITSKTGVTRYDALDVSINKLAFILLQDPDDEATPEDANRYVVKDKNNKDVVYDYSNLWKPEWKNSDAKHYAVYYYYEAAPDKCKIDPAKDDVFIVTVYNAIQNLAKFKFTSLKDGYQDTNYENFVDGVEDKNANDFINLDRETVENKKDIKCWFTGLDGQLKQDGLPSYYTSYPAFKNNNYSSISFHYIDIIGEERTLPVSKVSGLITTAEGEGFTAQIEVNFYGIGTFKFNYTYSVYKPLYKAIRQTKTINIPVNANASAYLLDYPLNLVGQDGNEKAVKIESSVFSSVSPFNTTTLGMHTAEVKYTDIDAVEPLSLTVYYTVVLEADETMFNYEIKKDPFNGAPGEACITGFSKGVSAEEKREILTLVLPSKCNITSKNLLTNKDETAEYIITQIGDMNTADGIFEGMESLTAVYLPETLKCIGVNTFNGCKNLKNVYTAVQADSTAVTLDREEYFTPFGDRYQENITDDNGNVVTRTIQPVKLTSIGKYDNADVKELIIASDYKVADFKVDTPDESDVDAQSDGENVNNLIYRIVAVDLTFEAIVVKDLDIYLPDTIYYPVTVKDAKDSVTPHFYKSENNFMIKARSRVPSSLVTIGKQAFSGCISLERINLSEASSLENIGAMAFQNTGLKEINLSKNTKVTIIQSGLFDGCNVLEEVTLHSGIIEIESYAFKECYALKTVKGELKNVKYIAQWAFNKATSLTRFDLYNDDKGSLKVELAAFAVCRALTIYCHFDKPSENWDSWNGYKCPIVWNCDTNEVADDGRIYYIDNESGIRYVLDASNNTAAVARQASSFSGDVVIPASITLGEGDDEVEYTITSIDGQAFIDNANITSVIVSSSLKSIGASAFSGCSGLAIFGFSDSNGLDKIVSTAFDGCTSLAQKPQISGAATNQD
ncbi:MAG: leucine-rich repeat domain-containing protein [Bacteroides sp.]|nr:leucine-rich repeat domain-containing protein [Bacillota bacterium]MCM1393687.1 leucine-rich repeat domain-containing protein [[Eubacterium] siraeum]MCM1455214.1 leucine-rich repeat domain-containing protein [Bacteroides sp.]